MQFMILMQGVPGSGKSTLANQMGQIFGAKVCSTDDFHCGVFQFQNLGYYHSWNQWLANYYLREGYSVIVDNTNTRQVVAQPYISMAKSAGVKIYTHRCTGEYKSIHNVPEQVIAQMKARMQNLVID